MRINVVFWVTPLIMTLFAGCLVGSGDAYQVYATNGKFAVGFAYDGKGVESFAGPAFLDVKEGANTGVFVAQGKAAGTDYRIVFEDFSEAMGKPFQNGGIAGDFREHGASGVGDKTVPEVDLEMAGWGTASIQTGSGKSLYKDPISGKDTWSAHFMVIRNGVRNDTNNQIHTKDHKIYSPMEAANGTGTPGDYELHLVLRNHTGNASTPSQIGPFPTSAPMANPSFTARHTFKVDSPGSLVTLDIGVGGSGVTATNLTFTVNDPSGDQAVRRALGPGMTPVAPQAAYSANLRFTAIEVGEYTVMVSGRLAPGGTYSVKGTVTPPPSVVLNFWWEDLIFGEEADEKGEASGMLEGTRYHGTHDHPAGSSSSMSAVPGRKMR